MRPSRSSTRPPLVTLCAAVLAAGCSGRRAAPRPTDLGADPPVEIGDEVAAPPVASGPSEPAVEPPTIPGAGLDVRYAAQGARPPVSMSLHVAPDGAAELVLTSSWSSPSQLSDTLGEFAVVLEPARREALARLIDEHDLLNHDPGEPPTSPDLTTRTLSLARDGRRNTMAMTAAVDQGPETLAAVERLLGEIIDEVSRHPVRAVRATWELAPDGGRVRPTIVVAHAGRAPARGLLFDPDERGFRLRAEAWFESEVALPSGRRRWTPVGDRTAAAAVLERLAGEGTLPTGELELAPGAEVRFALPSFAPPVVEGALQAHGVLALQFLGPGLARSVLTFDLPGLPVSLSAPAPAPTP